METRVQAQEYSGSGRCGGGAHSEAFEMMKGTRLLVIDLAAVAGSRLNSPAYPDFDRSHDRA